VEVIRNNRAQHSIEDEDSQSSDEPVAEPVRKKKRTADQEATAERSRMRKGKAKVNFIEQIQAVLRKLKKKI
jgi:hypothetical protein